MLMQVDELVAKYIVDRDSVFQHPNAFDALLRLGHDPESNRALKQGAQLLNRQLYGNSMVFLALTTPDGEQLRLEFVEGNLKLDGSDASLLEQRSLPQGKGLVWRRLGKQETELVESGLHSQPDYAEFSRGTKAVYNAPMTSGRGTFGVFSIETSDPNDFLTPKLFNMISNLAELVILYTLNGQIQSLQQGVDRLHQKVDSYEELQSRRDELEQNLALGASASWHMMMLLDQHTALGLEALLASTGNDPDALQSLCRLCLLGYVRYHDTQLALTQRGLDALSRFGFKD